MRALKRGLCAAIAAATTVGLVSVPALGASFTPLGTLDGDVYSSALALSADGSTVVGMSVSGSGRRQAFIWDPVDGMRGLFDPQADFGSLAVGVSADGSTVVGNAEHGAFIWDEVHGAQYLELLELGYAVPTLSARDVSADGSTIVGNRYGGPFIWDAENGAGDLGNLPGASRTAALRLSADGSTAVGDAITPSGQRAVIWQAATGFRDLGVLPGAGTTEPSAATGVSADGSIVVGGSASAFGNEAFVWDAVNGMQSLGDLAGGFAWLDSLATDVSADGSIIVGRGSTDDGAETFVWDAVHGMRELDVLLTTLGIDLTGWALNRYPSYTDFPKISADGRTIVGVGSYEGRHTAYVAIIPEPSTALLLGVGLAGLVLGHASRHSS